MKTINNHDFISKTKSQSTRRDASSANDELFERGVTSEVATSSIVKEKIRRGSRRISEGVKFEGIDQRACLVARLREKILFAHSYRIQFAFYWIAYYRLSLEYICAKLTARNEENNSQQLANLLYCNFFYVSVKGKSALSVHSIYRKKTFSQILNTFVKNLHEFFIDFNLYANVIKFLFYVYIHNMFVKYNINGLMNTFRNQLIRVIILSPILPVITRSVLHYNISIGSRTWNRKNKFN